MTTPTIDSAADPDAAPGTALELRIHEPMPATVGLPSADEQRGIVELAEKLSESGIAPKGVRGNASNIAHILLIARDLRIAPAWALSKIYVVEGTPAMSAELMRGIVQREGHHIHFKESSRTSVTIVGWRKGEPEYATEVTWSMDDAKTAGLAGRQVWNAYPRQMLTARATSELCRMLFGDVLMGLTYAPEDFDATVGANGNLITTPAPSEPVTTPVDPDWLRETVLDAFRDMDFPEQGYTTPGGTTSGHQHPYHGVPSPVDRLLALWAYCRQQGFHMDGVEVAGTDGALMAAQDFFTMAGRAAKSGDTLSDTSDAVIDAEVVPEQTPESASEPTATSDATAGWMAELHWQAEMLGRALDTLTRRQCSAAQVSDPSDLGVDGLTSAVCGTRQAVVNHLRQDGQPNMADAYESLIAQVTLEDGAKAPVDMSALGG